MSSELERISLSILKQMVTNPTTTDRLDMDALVGKAWKYAEVYLAEREKRREIAEVMKELEG